MAQIRLSIAFILAAAAIAPIVAQPIHHEFADNDGHRLHYLHHHHHQRVAVPEKSSLEPTFEPVVHTKPQIVARGLLSGGGINRLPQMPHLGSGPVITGIRHHGRVRPGPQIRMPHLGLGPARHGPVRPWHAVFSREYPEFDDMFERELEDVDFGARDFDDDFYLD